MNQEQERKEQQSVTAGDLEKELRALTSEQRADFIRFLRNLSKGE